MDYILGLNDRESFSRQDYYYEARRKGFTGSDETLNKRISLMLNDGEIARVGRNKYVVKSDKMYKYKHQYSALSCRVVNLLKEKYLYLEFTIFELIQLNEFVNHLLAHNIVFLSVEGDIIDFVFDMLKEAFPGKVLIDPTQDVFDRYWTDDMIVLLKLVTEYPKSKNEPWQIRIEKLLVDIMAEPLIRSSFGASEFPTIFEDVFSKFVIDESCLFRYARRRGIENNMIKFITEETNVRLRTRSDNND